MVEIVNNIKEVKIKKNPKDLRKELNEEFQTATILDETWCSTAMTSVKISNMAKVMEKQGK